jgi:hypothetical protein
MRQEKLSQLLVKVLLFSGLGVTLFALLFWVGSYAFASIVRPELSRAQELSKKAALDLLVQASNANQSPVHKHMVRIQALLDVLMGFGGTLTKYEYADGKVQWEALVPPAMQGDLGQLRAKAVGLENGRLRIRGTN